MSKRNCPFFEIKFGVKQRRVDASEVQVVPDIDDDAEKQQSTGNCLSASSLIATASKSVVMLSTPKPGERVNRRNPRKAGPFLIGPEIGQLGPMLNCMVQYLARKENSREFYQLKILYLNDKPDDLKSVEEERQGKMFMITEYKLLTLLKGEYGVIQQHGLFWDTALVEEHPTRPRNSSLLPGAKPTYTGKLKKRLILVLDSVAPHKYKEDSHNLVNLQQFLMERKMNEGRAIIIFYEIIKVIENLHKKNVIHRDLKAANIVLNRRSYKIILTNFSLGKQLLNENDLLNDKVGTPNYISPDVLSHQPYRGKPSDMWALGVVFYMMIYGELPFFERNTTDLFKKIRMGDYKMPDSDASTESKKLIKDILEVNPVLRLTATQVRERLEKLITAKLNRSNIHLDLIVPDIDTMAMEPEDDEPAGPSFKPFSSDLNLSFSQWLKCQKARKGQLFGSLESGLGMNQIMNKDNKTTVFLLKPKIVGNRFVPSTSSPSVPSSSELNLSSTSAPTLSSIQTASSASSSTPSLRLDVIESITEAFNEHFLRNRQIDAENRQLVIFNGVITQELSQKMYDWLRAEFANNPILRFFVSNTNPNKFEKIKEFLVNLCVNIQCVVNDCLVLKRQQSRDILIILNYIFKNVGYRTTYFLPISNLRPFS